MARALHGHDAMLHKTTRNDAREDETYASTAARVHSIGTYWPCAHSVKRSL